MPDDIFKSYQNLVKIKFGTGYVHLYCYMTLQYTHCAHERPQTFFQGGRGGTYYLPKKHLKTYYFPIKSQIFYRPGGGVGWGGGGQGPPLALPCGRPWWFFLGTESCCFDIQKCYEFKIISWLEFWICNTPIFFQQELIRVLLDWINDELHTDRIIVQDVEEDLYDGQVLYDVTLLRGQWWMNLWQQCISFNLIEKDMSTWKKNIITCSHFSNTSLF